MCGAGMASVGFGRGFVGAAVPVFLPDVAGPVCLVFTTFDERTTKVPGRVRAMLPLVGEVCAGLSTAMVPRGSCAPDVVCCLVCLLWEVLDRARVVEGATPAMQRADRLRMAKMCSYRNPKTHTSRLSVAVVFGGVYWVGCVKCDRVWHVCVVLSGVVVWCGVVWRKVEP